MGRVLPALAAASIAAFSPAQAADDVRCQLCTQAREEKVLMPLQVQVESGLDFSRLALVNRGDGEAEIDPETGSKRTRNNLIDLGGSSFEGRALVTGEPFESVRIEMPKSVVLYSAAGSEASLTDFVTNLPEFPTLDANGKLSFSFGAVLRTQGGKAGNFRGRIPIRVDYD